MRADEVSRKIKPVLKQRAITRAGIFGSTARGEPSPRDVDVLVEMPRPYGLFAFLALKNELEDTLGIKVDLVDYASIKSTLRENILHDEIRII